jgi:hypothetical protein
VASGDPVISKNRRKIGGNVIYILGAGLECEDALKKLRGNNGRNKE